MDQLFQNFQNQRRFLSTLARERGLEDQFVLDDYAGAGGGSWDSGEYSEDSMDYYLPSDGRPHRTFSFQRGTRARRAGGAAAYDPVSLNQRARSAYQLGELGGGGARRRRVRTQEGIPKDLTKRILSVLKKVHDVSKKRQEEKERKKKEKEMKTFQMTLEKQISEIEKEQIQKDGEKKEKKEGEAEKKESSEEKDPSEDSSQPPKPERMQDEDDPTTVVEVDTGDQQRETGNISIDFQTPDRGSLFRSGDGFFSSLDDGPLGISPIIPLEQPSGPASPPVPSQNPPSEGQAEVIVPPRPPAAVESESQEGEVEQQQQEQPSEGSQQSPSEFLVRPSTPPLLEPNSPQQQQQQEGGEQQQQQQTPPQQQQEEEEAVPPAPIDFPIDPSFLVALPDDLRREIIQQNLPSLIGTRQAGEPDGGGTTISSQFLDVVTDGIRQEILNQERALLASQQQVFQSFGGQPAQQQQQQPPSQQPAQPASQPASQPSQQGGQEGGQSQQGSGGEGEQQPQQQQQQQEGGQGEGQAQQQGGQQGQGGEVPQLQPAQANPPPASGGGARPVVIPPQRSFEQYDPALFIQSLPPHLRREVLMTAENDVINRLPPDLASEALRLRSRPAYRGFGGGGAGLDDPYGALYARRRGRGRGRGRAGTASGRAKSKNEFQEIRNKSGDAILSDMDIVSILRLLYVHPLFSREQVHRIFKNLLPVEKSRKFVFRLLLGVLTHRVDGHKTVKIPSEFHKHLLMEKTFGGKKEYVEEEEEEEEVEGEGESDDELELLEESFMIKKKVQKMVDEDEDEDEVEEEEEEGKEKKKKRKITKVFRIPKLVRERVIDLISLLAKDSHTFTELFTSSDEDNGVTRNPTYSLLRIFHHNTTSEALRVHIIALVNRIYDIVKLRDGSIGKQLKKKKEHFQRFENVISTLKKETDEAKKREDSTKKKSEEEEGKKMVDEDEEEEEEKEKEGEKKKEKKEEKVEVVIEEVSTPQPDIVPPVQQQQQEQEQELAPKKKVKKKRKRKKGEVVKISAPKTLEELEKERIRMEKTMAEELEKIDGLEEKQKKFRKETVIRLTEDPLIRSLVRVLISKKKRKRKGGTTASSRKYDKDCISILHTVGELGGNPKRKIILQELSAVVGKEAGTIRKDASVKLEAMTWKNLVIEKVFRFQRFLESYVDLYNRIKGKNEFDAQAIQFLKDDALDHIWKMLGVLFKGVDFTKPSEETSILTPLIQSFITFHSMFIGGTFISSGGSSQPPTPSRQARLLEPSASQEDLDEFGMIPHTPTDITIRNVVGDDGSMLLTETPQMPVSAAEKRLEVFFEQHRDSINDLLFTNPQLLLGGSSSSSRNERALSQAYLGLGMVPPSRAIPGGSSSSSSGSKGSSAGSFKFLLFSPNFSKYISFENKRVWFLDQLKKRQRRTFGRTMQIRVRRSHIFPDAFYQISKMRTAELKAKLRVHFEGEPAQDAGGVTREFFLLLSQQVINPEYGIFQVMDDKTTYQPNPLSARIDPAQHLNYFKFAGRVIGMAIYHEQLIDCYFTRSFYKHILGRRILYSDVESIDPTVYKNLKWVIEKDVTGLGFTFSLEENEFGRVKVIDLKPGGSSIPVTNENKLEYVRLVTDFKMVKGIEAQLKAFLEGLYGVIPKKTISIFSEHELELLMNGTPDFDTEDLKSNCRFHGYTATSKVIVWFWRWVEGLSRDEKSLFLQFVTGTSKIPLGGFANLLGNSGVQLFNIHKVHLDPHTAKLPTSHTCFNQLDLPDYKSESHLRDSCYIAIREGYKGFGFI